MTTPLTRTHGLIPMTGRDRNESHRAATPLELLYDLTFVVAFSIAGSQLAHALTEGHAVTGVIAFTFAMAAMVWAWINFSWFASAYDTDDWAMRLATLVQMIGVLVFGLGLPQMFEAAHHGHLDNQIMVVGYVILRVSQVSLWLRAAHEDPAHSSTLRRYALCITSAQVLWVVVAFGHLPTAVAVPLGVVVFAFEFWSVYAAERRNGTPWHPHHIAERYSLLAIISLGEVILGTTTAIEAVVAAQGWTVEAALIGIAGVSLAVGMWWTYFSNPFAEIIERKPEKSFGWGYSHVLLYAAIAAVGAGLHVAAYFIEGKAKVSETGVMLMIAVPLGVFLVLVYALFHYLLPGRDAFHWFLLAATLVVLVVSVLLPEVGASLGVSLVVLMFVPWITVVGYETVGARKIEEHLAA
ncbi:low temperature requirement protein A [Knoellia sp. CPCC 206453]|uniref:low temperature requirement protein A n=1 Tax=Knoellia pratensis TaxID=3404796 RepID=UPI00360B77C5